MLRSANNNDVKFIKVECFKHEKIWVFRILRKIKFIIFTILFLIIIFLSTSAWTKWNIKLMSFKIVLPVKLFLTILSISTHEKTYLSVPYPMPLLLSPLHATRSWSNVFEFFHTKKGIEFTSLCKLKMRRVCSNHQTTLLK